ncbi:hypothetical protein O181_133272 [Austropuccinia psidii MF-1]|uniref:Uncharacterized protein n=1 Tax=Austropuccinia psidii MF-1 TaxID=1389203 RepID=A0A9Q3QED5_9BASI|nr:hypothetical protein [Austropuccinia psidii MF-1]
MSGILAIAGKLDYKKRLPGKSYCYTDKYISCPDTRVVQEAREQSLTQLRVMAESSLNRKLNWPLLAKDVDNAALLHAYSRGQVSLKLNPKVNRNKLCNFSLFYKTRKYGDDCIENAVTIALGNSSVPSTSLPPNPLKNPLHLDLIDQTILQEVYHISSIPNMTCS